MGRKARLNRDAWLPLWRVCVILFLVVLLLYNPFTALKGSSGHLSYEKLPRHRANIGSGELQHFTPVSNFLGHVDTDADVNDAGPAAPVPQYRTTRDQHELLPFELELLAGVWFRPPPSL